MRKFSWPCADLHPGNILVRVVDPNSTWGRIAHFCNLKTAPHLVLLDVGMTCEMSAYDKENIVQFFQARTRLLLSWVGRVVGFWG